MSANTPVTKAELEDALNRHSADFMDAIQTLERAFPDGVENHRRAHEKMIKAAEAEERFWTELKGEIAKKSIWGILQILTILVAAGLAAKITGLAAVLPLFGSGK